MQSRASCIHYNTFRWRWRPKERPMFWPPHFSWLKHILNTPCFLAHRASCCSPSTLPNLTCLLSDASRAWEAVAAAPSTRVRIRDHYGSFLLHMAAQTDPDTASCSPLIHQCTARTRSAMSTDACSTLWPSYKFQNLQPSSIFMTWARRAQCHETIHKGAVKDRHSLYSPSTLIQALSSFNYLQTGRFVRGQSSHSTEIIVESTASNWILT